MGFAYLPELWLRPGAQNWGRRDPNCGWRYRWSHPRSDGLEVNGVGRAGSVATPLGVFSEVFILKGFKCCVLEVRILKGLRVGFSEVRILKDLVICDPEKAGASW